MAENFDITTNENEEEFVVDFGEVTRLGGGGGTSDFNDLTNRPQYNNEPMTGNTNIPKVPSKTSDLENDSDYQTGSDVEGAISSAIADKQDALTAGDNITIEDNTISATDTTYTAGTNISISSGNVISATDTTYTAGANVSISDENVISATDTTYSNFTGTDGNTGGTSGLVPAPATTDADKFLKSDGTWATAGGGGGGGPTVVQTTGTSTTDVMSQDATTKLIYPDITNNPNKVVIGAGYIAGTSGTTLNGRLDGVSYSTNSIAIGVSGLEAAAGQNGRARNAIVIGGMANAGKGDYSIVIGYNSYSNSGSNNTARNIVIGANATINGEVTNAVSLGSYAKATRTGEVNIGTNGNNSGYNSTDYRVIGGVHDGQDAHDAATVSQVNATIDAINTALNTSIPHIGAA